MRKFFLQSKLKYPLKSLKILSSRSDKNMIDHIMRKTYNAQDLCKYFAANNVIKKNTCYLCVAFAGLNQFQENDLSRY